MSARPFPSHSSAPMLFARPPRRGGIVASVIAALTIAPAPAVAQDAVGELTRAIAIVAPGECPELTGLASGETVNIRRGTTLTPANPPSRIFLTDVVTKPSAVLARVRVDAAARGSGVLYLVPSVECYPGIPARARIAGVLPLGQTSEYEVDTRQVVVGGRTEDRLAVVIQRGALVVQWNRGAPLLVVAAADTVTITGTTVAFSVDETGDRAVVYVRDGTVTVSRLEGGPVRAGEVVRLQRGAVPVRAPRDPAARTMDDAIRYYSGSAWSLRSAPALQLGLKVGGTSSDMSNAGNNDIETDRLTAVGGGGFLRLGFGGFALQLEALYLTRGYTTDSGVISYKLKYLEMPLLLRLDLGSGMRAAPYVMVGPSLSVETGCDVDFDYEDAPTGDCDEFGFDTKSTDVGGTGVVGIELALGPGSLFVEGRYTHGFTNVIATEGLESRNRTFGLFAGYSFPLGVR